MPTWRAAKESTLPKGRFLPNIIKLKLKQKAEEIDEKKRKRRERVEKTEASSLIRFYFVNLVHFSINNKNKNLSNL